MCYSHLLFNIKYTIALTQCTSIDTEAERVSPGEGFNRKKEKNLRKRNQLKPIVTTLSDNEDQRKYLKVYDTELKV